LSLPITFALCLLPSERGDLDLGGLLDHVRVGERDAGGVDDDAGAEAALRASARARPEEAAEEVFAEELLERRPAAGRRRARPC
jgi:hypothetical protein